MSWWRAGPVVVALAVAVIAVLLAACSAGPAASRPTATPATATPATATPATPTPAPAGSGTGAISQRVEPSLPDARQETAAAADERGLWVIGGYDAASRPSSDVLRFDGTAWHREPSLPVAVDHPSAAALGGVVYVAGGFGDGVPSRRVFALPGNRELTPLRHARGALALIPLGGRLYAIGGNGDGGNVAPPEEYDPAANRWRDLPDLPAPRNHVAGFAYGGMACVAGGRSPNVALVTCWDPRTAAWRELQPLPMPTSAAGAGVLGGDVVVAGGENPAGGRVVTQLARLHDGAWHLGGMSRPRHGIQLAPFRGRLWACGGGDAAGLHQVATCTSVGLG